MVNRILDGILPYKEVRFLRPPRETYAVYFDDIDHFGGDDLIALEYHAVRIEVYSEYIDREVEAQIEQKLIDLNIPFNVNERTWLNSEQLYMTVFYFEYTIKKEAK